MRKASKPRATGASREAQSGPEPLLKPFEFTGWDFQVPELALAETNAASHDESAAFFDSNNRKDLADEERRRATWWRRLSDLPESDAVANQLYLDCVEQARVAIDTLLVRSKTSDATVFALSRILGQLLTGFHALAAQDNQTAARTWVNMLNNGVNDFEMLATNKPELFKKWARGRLAIPGQISRNKEKQADTQRLLNQLQQGADAPFAILPKGKRGRTWKFQDKANALVARLWSHVENARLLYDVHEIQAQEAGRKLPAWLKSAKALEPISANNWRAWADVSWSVLAEISLKGKPGLHPAFYEAATQICTVCKQRWDIYYGKVVTAPSIAENDIKEALFGAFELVVTGISNRTKRRRTISSSSGR